MQKYLKPNGEKITQEEAKLIFELRSKVNRVQKEVWSEKVFGLKKISTTLKIIFGQNKNFLVQIPTDTVTFVQPTFVLATSVQIPAGSRQGQDNIRASS